jgi:hypothetical protein
VHLTLTIDLFQTIYFLSIYSLLHFLDLRNLGLPDDDAVHPRNRSGKAWSDSGAVRVSAAALSQVCRKRKAADRTACRK